MVSISREEFAEALYYWVTKDLSENTIKDTASSLDFEIESDEDYDTIFQELLTLKMYLVVAALESAFEDEERRDDCLDRLHLLIFDRHYGAVGVSLDDWMMSMETRYREYREAIESEPEHPTDTFWVISKTVNDRLFGEIEEYPVTQLSIGQYIALNLKHLSHLIHEHDIE